MSQTAGRDQRRPDSKLCGYTDFFVGRGSSARGR
jgi:hypothetical protein